MVSGEIEAVMEHPGRSPVRICALSPDSTHLVSGASDGTLALWDFPSKQLIRTGGVTDHHRGLLLQPLQSAVRHRLHLRRSASGGPEHEPSACREKNVHDLGVTCCTFAPTSSVWRSGAVSSGVLWTGQSPEGLEHHKFTSGGTEALQSSSFCTNRVYKMQLLHTFTSQSAPVLSCAFSSDDSCSCQEKCGFALHTEAATR
ncbi:hypothetical protein INR49_026750 [Caranx melampygus]|nr:hypothetical protein INR49_026750 [Caranx melampygus]